MSAFGRIKRSSRQRRATAVAAVRAGAANLRGKDRFAVLALANDLEAVLKDTKLTGAQKDERFKALMAHVR